jgi:RHS repeat-associated protein
MGLSYFGARYYDGGAEGPSLRWISPDPITTRIHDPESLNKYTYVRNDPINLIDPDGRNEAAPNGDGPSFLWRDWEIYAPTAIIYGGEGEITGLNIGLSPEPGDDIANPDIPGTEPSGGDTAITWRGLEQSATDMLKARDNDCLNWITGLFRKYWSTGHRGVDVEANVQKDVENFQRYIGVLNYQAQGQAATFIPKPNDNYRGTSADGRTWVTVAQAGMSSSTIIFYQAFFNQSLTGQAQTLIHEGTHLAMYGDQILAQLATGKRYVSVEDASVAYQGELVKHCK